MSAPKITVIVSATTATPHPPGLSDGSVSLPPGSSEQGAKDFTILVEEGQTIQFVGGGDLTISGFALKGPSPFKPSDHHKYFPGPQNHYTGVIGSFGNNDVREFTITYHVKGHGDYPYSQDPQLQMKR